MASNPILTIDGKIVTNGFGGVCYRPPSDTTPPIVVLSNTPANRVSATTTDVTVSDNDVVAYKYKLDGGDYGTEIPVATHIQLSGLSEAEHTLYVVGRDTAGNWQTEPTTCAWIVDLTPPVATLSGTPVNPTPATTTDITVGGDDVVAYKYKLDAGTWSAETPVETHIQLSGLSVASHTLSVIGKDTAGNWKPENEATEYTWTVSMPLINFTSNLLTLDGVDDSASVSDNNAFSFANNIFTIECWVKFDGAKSEHGFIQKGYNGSAQWEYSLHIDSAGALQTYAWSLAGYGVYIPGGVTNFRQTYSGTWVHIAFTANGSNSYTYVNGVQRSTVAKNAPYSMGNGNSPVYLGFGAVYNRNLYAKGNIKEVRIWNVYKTGSEILANKDSQIDVPNVTGLVGYYKLDGNANDFSGNNRHGSLSGAYFV